VIKVQQSFLPTQATLSAQLITECFLCNITQFLWRFALATGLGFLLQKSQVFASWLALSIQYITGERKR